MISVPSRGANKIRNLFHENLLRYSLVLSYAIESLFGASNPTPGPRFDVGPRRTYPTRLIISWDWSVLRCRVVSQVEEHFIHVTPAPPLGRIITLDDQMTCRTKMTGCMTTWRLIATTNVTARPADSEVNPFATGFQTLLATACAWFNLPDGT